MLNQARICGGNCIPPPVLLAIARMLCRTIKISKNAEVIIVGHDASVNPKRGTTRWTSRLINTPKNVPIGRPTPPENIVPPIMLEEIACIS